MSQDEPMVSSASNLYVPGGMVTFIAPLQYVTLPIHREGVSAEREESRAEADVAVRVRVKVSV